MAAPSTPAFPIPFGNRTAALFLVSVLGLFLELLMIRWVSTEVRIFAYLQNTVLVVCFLGLGLGAWDSARRPFVLRDLLIPLAILVTLLAIPTTRIGLGKLSEMLNVFDSFVIWQPLGEQDPWMRLFNGAAGALLTLGLMLLLWDVFLPLGRLLGRLLDEDPKPIRAYTVNLAGSLLGIWLFVALSGLQQPPVVWFLVFAATCVPLFAGDTRRKMIDGALLGGILVGAFLAGFEPGWEEVRWSPYQKLALRDMTRPPSPLLASLRAERLPADLDVGTHFVAVNNAAYQAMLDLSPATVARAVAANPDRFPPEQAGYSQYDLPAMLHPGPKSMLIVGAGSGNDAAGALRHDVDRVVAVEIDPAIIQFGKRLHPERPYDDARVTVVNDDARSYFAYTDQRFDVITFGLLDSHTSGSAMTNARLDHYVYTRESLEQARTLLEPGGIIVLSFEVHKPYIADRISLTLQEVFGVPPMVFRVPLNGHGWGGVFFVAGDIAAAERQIAADPKLGALVAGWKANMPFELPGATAPVTDDWPYLYLERPRLPTLYLLLAALLGALFYRGVRTLDSEVIRDWGRSSWHFLFLGAAFLLLETQNVSKAAVVLGNTWTVNAVIISGILAMALVANGIAAAFPRLPTSAAYAALIASCLAMYWIDLAAFAFLPYPTKVVLVGLLTSLPMLFSGIVFVRSFAETERKDAAIGANLFGSLIGGLLQTLTFVVGIKALLLGVAALYLGAMFTQPAPGAPKAAKPATS